MGFTVLIIIFKKGLMQKFRSLGLFIVVFGHIGRASGIIGRKSGIFNRYSLYFLRGEYNLELL